MAVPDKSRKEVAALLDGLSKSTYLGEFNEVRSFNQTENKLAFHHAR